MSTIKRRLRGENAARFLKEPVFRETLDACLRLVQTRWASTKPEDAQSRELLFHQFTAVHDFEDMLGNFVEDGKRAEREEEENGD